MDSHTKKGEFKDILPWSFIETGMNPQYLWEEYQGGLKEKISPPCTKENCHRCGICKGKSIFIRESDPTEVIALGKIVSKESRKKGIKKKIRLKFRKVGEMRFLSHLELVHLFYRASMRAQLPLSYSEGFHPMPRMIFATALPVGMESLTEVVDMEFEGNITPFEVMEGLNRSLPPGVEILEAEEVPVFFHLSSSLHPSVYWIPLDRILPKEEAIAEVTKALDKTEFFIHQERDGKKRKVDIRPLIEKIEIKEKSGEDCQWGVELVLRRVTGRTAKPTEIVGAILGLEGEPLAQVKVIKLE